MKVIITITSYLIFTCGTIICVSGILIMIGLSRFFSGAITGVEQNNILFGAINIISIMSGGKLFVEGLLVIAVSQIELMLLEIATKR
jgi:hypothetical protein